jgi:hypothetical protein
MLNEKNRCTCQHPDCDKPATRALTYFVDAPAIASVDPKQEQEPGIFTQTRWDGTNVDCTVNQLTNEPLEDGCCHKRTKHDSLAARVGADTDFCEEL